MYLSTPLPGLGLQEYSPPHLFPRVLEGWVSGLRPLCLCVRSLPIDFSFIIKISFMYFIVNFIKSKVGTESMFVSFECWFCIFIFGVPNVDIFSLGNCFSYLNSSNSKGKCWSSEVGLASARTALSESWAAFASSG